VLDVISGTQKSEINPAVFNSQGLDQQLDGYHVLLVEDSVDNQKLFTRILTADGAVVDVADNGFEGVSMERENTYDVILMDIRMPLLDGYQAARLIRQHGFEGPIVALTAHALPGEEERCLAAGCSHFLTKPIDKYKLLSTLRGAVNT
jgi:CheY-like chemotaxis protein